MTTEDHRLAAAAAGKETIEWIAAAIGPRERMLGSPKMASLDDHAVRWARIAAHHALQGSAPSGTRADAPLTEFMVRHDGEIGDREPTIYLRCRHCRQVVDSFSPAEPMSVEELSDAVAYIKDHRCRQGAR